MLEKAQKMLQKHPLCNNCLGRQFALLGYGVDNEKRGEALKLLLTMKAHQLALLKEKTGFTLLETLASNGNFQTAMEIFRKMKNKHAEGKPCYLCNGRFDLLKGLLNLAIDKLKNYECNNLLVGIELPIEIEERGDEFKGKFMVEHGESMRNEFSRSIGKKIAEATGKAIEYARPEVVVLVNPFTEQITLQVNPLFIRGRYRKLERGIPQSRWFCRSCKGKGCPKCNWTGKMYQESVEEIVGNPALEITQGENIAFHGAGREDIDARMLGLGRPFVIEVKKPKKRFINLRRLQKIINEKAAGRVQVSNLCFADKEVVRGLKKSEAAEKLYRVVVEADKPVSNKQLAMLQKSFAGALISQQTPRRVIHRRADLTREKYIYKTTVKRLTPNSFEMKIRCQGGLYIKELVTGDEGRTVPSVTEILSIKAVPIELDVLGVYIEEEKASEKI
jgi:tRNA pseudouridine synthase 10